MRSEPRKLTALILAIFQGNVDCVRHLINAEAGVNYIDSKDTNALKEAAYFGYLKYVKALIAAGADVNSTKKYNNTTLMMAAQCGHKECLKSDNKSRS